MPTCQGHFSPLEAPLGIATAQLKNFGSGPLVEGCWGYGGGGAGRGVSGGAAPLKGQSKWGPPTVGGGSGAWCSPLPPRAPLSQLLEVVEMTTGGATDVQSFISAVAAWAACLPSFPSNGAEYSHALSVRLLHLCAGVLCLYRR